MQKWEYSILIDVEKHFLFFLPDGSAQIFKRKFDVMETNRDVTQIFAYLGNEGWELVSTGGAIERYYFKRPKA